MLLSTFISPAEPGPRQRRLWTGLFFGVLVLLGLWLVRDYGLSVDEAQSRSNGMVSLHYVSQHYFPGFLRAHPGLLHFQTPLQKYYDRDYGVAFELPVSFLEQVLGLTDLRDSYFLRHLCTYGVWVLGVWGVYRLGRRRFADWRLGLLGALLLVLTPRLFAEAFYNDKDVVFMALFALATNSAVALVARPSWGRAAGHALLCALTIDVRIMGVLLPLATLALLGAQLGHGAYAGQRGRLAGQVGLYLLLLVGLTIACWPYLWEKPGANFALAFHNMSQFRWNSNVLYQGKETEAVRLPWHYASVWIGMTTPVLYLVGFLAGTFVILRQLARRGWHLYATPAEWQDLLFLGLTLAPILAIIALHSVVYDGWRQLYFVYPSLLLVALRGLVALARWRPTAPASFWQRAWPRLCAATLAASLLLTAGQMVALHPLQNVYFNFLPGRHLETRYELDYWVLSYRQGLAWIAQHDSRLHIRVNGQMPAVLEANRQLLPDFERARLEIVANDKDADYYVTTYRWHPDPYLEYPEEVLSLRAGGQRVLSIFRTKW